MLNSKSGVFFLVGFSSLESFGSSSTETSSPNSTKSILSFFFWSKAERNESNVNRALRQSSPPLTACLNIKLIYNQGWVQSSAGGNRALAEQRARAALTEAETAYNYKYSSSNRLGTRITFNLVGGKLF